MKPATFQQTVPAAAIKERASLMMPKHFREVRTSLTDRGLVFDQFIGHYDRESEIIGFDDELIKHIAQLETRCGSQCVANPNSPSLGRLKSNMDRAQRHLPPDEEIKLIHKLPADYIRRWSATTDDSFISEGQIVVMVCFDRRTAVGYACLDLCLSHELHDSSYQMGVEAELVYVIPSRRGEGFGMDLSVACGRLVSDILKAAYRAVPANSEITPCVSADLRSEGGEAFTNHLRNSLGITIDDLKHCGARRTIKFGEVEDDAGW